jgi:acyl carrier protein
MLERVIQFISEVGGIGSLEPGTDLYQAGFSSVRVLELLLALEEEFHVTIPDKEFVAARTPGAIAGLIERLQQEQPA